MLHILLETEFVDYNFFYWTVERGKATLRISDKQNREKQKIVSIIRQKGYQVFEDVSLSQLERVDYETGTDKIGIFKEINLDR